MQPAVFIIPLFFHISTDKIADRFKTEKEGKMKFWIFKKGQWITVTLTSYLDHEGLKTILKPDETAKENLLLRINARMQKYM